MNITIRTDDRGREVLVSNDPDWALFDEVADLISTELAGGEWVARLDGLDERYWDYRLDNAVVTLHLQHYLGIMLFASPDAQDQGGSEKIVDRIVGILTTYEPRWSRP